MFANKLHINIGKSCFIEFSGPKVSDEDTVDPINISGYTLEKVSTTKFLGVTIDENLNWDTHRAKLAKKLAACSGILNRIKDNIPSSLHKDLYHTLFESHLSYGITVWGGVSAKKLEPLFKAQKMCIRIMFGDKDAYLNKFKTCARAREFGRQNLGADFYVKEHTKPLFRKLELITVHNLYFYHCINDVGKILKYRTPISLHSLFKFSNRNGKDTLVYLPTPSDSFAYRAGKIWNVVCNKLKLTSFTFKSNLLKSSVKREILRVQEEGDETNWNIALNCVMNNFNPPKISPQININRSSESQPTP